VEAARTAPGELAADRAYALGAGSCSGGSTVALVTYTSPQRNGGALGWARRLRLGPVVWYQREGNKLPPAWRLAIMNRQMAHLWEKLARHRAASLSDLASKALHYTTESTRAMRAFCSCDAVGIGA
jgi:hypothetical protein